MSEAVLGGDDLFYQTPSTMNPDTHPLPAEALLNIHSIISRCFHIYAVEEQIQKGWPTEQGLISNPKFILSPSNHLVQNRGSFHEWGDFFFETYCLFCQP